MSSYSYGECLHNAYQVNWRISDVLGGRHFDASRRWLPLRLSGAARVSCLTPAEKIKLTQVEMGAYAHLFGYVEEFIAPTMVSLARDFAFERREAFDTRAGLTQDEDRWQAPRGAGRGAQKARRLLPHGRDQRALAQDLLEDRGHEPNPTSAVGARQDLEGRRGGPANARS